MTAPILKFGRLVFQEWTLPNFEFAGQNGKYLHFHDDGLSSDAEASQGFFLELRDPTRICIKSLQVSTPEICAAQFCFKLMIAWPPKLRIGQT